MIYTVEGPSKVAKKPKGTFSIIQVLHDILIKQVNRRHSLGLKPNWPFIKILFTSKYELLGVNCISFFRYR